MRQAMVGVVSGCGSAALSAGQRGRQDRPSLAWLPVADIMSAPLRAFFSAPLGLRDAAGKYADHRRTLFGAPESFPAGQHFL